MLEIWEFPGKKKVLSNGVTWLHMHVKKRVLTVVGMTDWMGRVGSRETEDREHRNGSNNPGER